MRLTSLNTSMVSVRMDAKVFTKCLYLARRHGWTPQRLPGNWPCDSWNTEVVMQQTSQYREGLVSSIDARGMREALEKILRVEGTAADPELRLAITQFIELLGNSAFLATERTTGETVMFAR